MADHTDRDERRPHHSIGEVLGLLLEEFPDVTISKIRFLESQGLIDPERTSSGYRRFYDDDIELLRCILREQKENYLPLRVIKDRIDSGEIDPTGEQQRPRGIRNVSDEPDTDDEGIAAATAIDREVQSSSQALHEHPAGHGSPAGHPSARRVAPEPVVAHQETLSSAPALLPGVLLTDDELCAMSGLDRHQLADLLTYHVIAPRPGSGNLFGEDALEVATVAKDLLAMGMEARHLRSWRVAADREAGLFEQLVQPLVRQRNPASRAQAVEQLTTMEELGTKLHGALVRAALRTHFES